MNSIDIRLECLRIAEHRAHTVHLSEVEVTVFDVVVEAQRYLGFVLGSADPVDQDKERDGPTNPVAANTVAMVHENEDPPHAPLAEDETGPTVGLPEEEVARHNQPRATRGDQDR